MKKIITAIVAVLYLITTSGVVVTLHYCMGKVSSAEYGVATVDFCGKCGMKEQAKQKGCCHTESKVFKLAVTHNYVKASVEFLKYVVEKPAQLFSFDQPFQGREKRLALQYHSPPDHRSTSVYLYNNVFRI